MIWVLGILVIAVGYLLIRSKPSAETVKQDLIQIRYADSAGDLSIRSISDIKKENETTLDAFCHLKQARRSFKLNRIISATNTSTGEVINPYSFVEPDGLKSIEAQTWKAMPAIKAIKFFILTTRGFRELEQKHFLQFTLEISGLELTDNINKLNDFLRDIWCGDIYAYNEGNEIEYRNLLSSIPNQMLGTCKRYALLIAKGTGRKPIDSKILERIEKDFG